MNGAMTLATTESVLTREALTRVGGTPRFVQLPPNLGTDSREPDPRWIQRTQLIAAPTDQLLAALVALLYRYSQQAFISLDVVSKPGAPPISLDFEVAGDLPIGTLIETARVLLGEGTSRRLLDAASRANVAVAFVNVSPDTINAFADGAEIATSSASYDLCFMFLQTGHETVLLVKRDCASQAPSLLGWTDCMPVLLRAVASDATLPIERLPLLCPSTLEAIAAVARPAPPSHAWLPVIRMFEASARRHAEQTAVTYRNQRITYRELDLRSNQLARRLLAVGVGPGTAVAVCVQPCSHILVAILAIWKARGIYLPIDPTHPVAVIRRMLQEAQPRLVLTQAALSQLTEGFPQLHFDQDSVRRLWEEQSELAPATEPSLSDPAYLIYTSGTTGKPKGVLATQANLAYYVGSALDRYEFNHHDTFLSVARYTFSISLFELIVPMGCGASLRILDRDEILTPATLCRALEQITVLHAGPSLLSSLIRHLQGNSPERSFQNVRHASSGGDIVSPSVMERMKSIFPNAEIFVIYGCTEISCMGTTFAVTRDASVGRTLVGKPFPGTQVSVLDANREPVPWGVVGEFYLSGDGVVPGYFLRPDITAERFVDIGGRRFYQTGDVGRLHPDGNLEILGRRDFQVQIRGIRIELVGIERVIQELELAAQCAVVAKTLDDGEVRLIAFLVKPRDEDLISTFRRRLAAELPDYMIPHHVVVLDTMPLTVNGKLDRNRLRELPFNAPAVAGSNESATPSTELERKIAEIFARVLNRPHVGLHDGFFEMGGDSLLGVVALDQVAKTLGVTIPPHVLFERGTVRELARHAGGLAAGRESKPVLLNQASGKPAVFLLSGMHIYRELTRRLETEWAAYGVFAPREFSCYDRTDAGDHCVEALALEYLDSIRTTQPQGPYRLIGYSFAGLVAYELARLLMKQGQDVRLVAMIDATLPEWSMGWRYRLSQISRIRSAPARNVAAFVLRRARERLLRLEDMEFVRYKQNAQLAPIEERRNVLNRIASERYSKSLQPYDGRVTLIVSGQRLRQDPLKSPSCGWAPYVRDLDLHTVDADHFSMLTDEPHISRVAEILSTALRHTELAHSQLSNLRAHC